MTKIKVYHKKYFKNLGLSVYISDFSEILDYMWSKNRHLIQFHLKLEHIAYWRSYDINILLDQMLVSSCEKIWSSSHHFSRYSSCCFYRSLYFPSSLLHYYDSLLILHSRIMRSQSNQCSSVDFPRHCLTVVSTTGCLKKRRAIGTLQ